LVVGKLTIANMNRACQNLFYINNNSNPSIGFKGFQPVEMLFFLGPIKIIEC
jgi:hypothetical protein